MNDLINITFRGGGRMKTKQLIFLITMTLSFVGFTENSYSITSQEMDVQKKVEDYCEVSSNPEACIQRELPKWKEAEAKVKKIADAKAAEKQRIVDNAMKGIKPERQKEFLSIVKTHADKYAKTKKEIKRSLYRKKRMKAFSEYFNEDLCFNNWVGTVKSLDTDKNGDAILAIDIGGFNFLNYGSKAIPMSNSLFDTLAEMEENDKVVLEGCFSKHNDSFADNWYLFTHEKTEKGSMTSPTFQGSYSDIKKTN